MSNSHTQLKGVVELFRRSMRGQPITEAAHSKFIEALKIERGIDYANAVRKLSTLEIQPVAPAAKA